MANTGNKWLINPYRYPTPVTMVVCYSLYIAVPSYSGNCIKVRRSSDNSTSDIGFSGGVLDISSLLSFVGSGSGFIDTWYDQSGNGNDAIQATTSLQPVIISSGALFTEHRLPTIKFVGGYLVSKNNALIGKKMSIIAVGKCVGGTYSPIVGNNAGGKFWVGKNINNYIYSSFSGRNNISTVSWLDSFRLVIEINDSYDNLFIDGVFSSKVVSPSNYIYDKISVGYSPGYSFGGIISEIRIYRPFIFKSKNTIESNILSYYLIPDGPTSNPDTTDAFLTATGITDETISGAIATLVQDMIDAGIWSKMIAVYPFVGGSADTHKYNLKDPRDTNDAYRLTFGGGLTHQSTGILPNGSTGYADTHYIPVSELKMNSQHYSYYSRTSGAIVNGIEIGASGATVTAIDIHFNGNYNCRIGSTSTYKACTTTHGLFTVSKYQSGKTSIYINGSSFLSNGTTGDTIEYTSPINLFCYNNNGTRQYFTTKECAFSTIGFGLSPTEVADLYTAVQAFQTTLGRNV